MNVEEVAKHLKRVDKLVLASSEVPEEDLSVNITDLYNRYKWGGAGPTPLPGAALSRLDLVERTADARWMRHFDGNGRELGVYRTTVGYYWLLRFDPALKQHSLQHVGTAADIDQRYGSQGMTSKSGTPPKKRRRKKKKSAPAEAADVTATTSTVKQSVRAGGGGVMQGLRAGFKRAAGGGSDGPEEKPSTLSNILWTVLLLAALGVLLYRWYG